MSILVINKVSETNKEIFIGLFEKSVKLNYRGYMSHSNDLWFISNLCSAAGLCTTVFPNFHSTSNGFL